MKGFKEILRLSIRNIGRHPLKNLMMGIMILLVCFMFFTTASLIKNSVEGWRAYLAATFLGNYNISMYTGLEKDYGWPKFALSEKVVPREIMNYLESNEILYSKRLRLGGIVYNEAKADFEKNMATVIGAEFTKEMNILSNLTITAGGYDDSIPECVLVWEEFARIMNWKLGDDITLFLKDIDNDAYPYGFRISGILGQKSGPSVEDASGETTAFPLIFVSYDYLSSLLSMENGYCTDLSIWNYDKYKERDLQALAHRHGLDFYFAEQGFGSLFGIIELIGSVGGFITLFILVILVVATINLNMLSFFDRQKEIGTILSIGAKPRWIMGLLFTEMVLFSIIAFTISLSLYFITSLVVSQGIDLGELNILFAGRHFYFDLVGNSVLTALLFVLGAVTISTLYPLYLTTKLNPVEVFREAAL